MADSAQPEVRPDDEPNPFAERLAADPSLGQVSLAERARLNAVQGYAGGTLTGAGNMPVLARDAIGGQVATDEFGNEIGTVPASATAAKRLESLRTDLARHDAMRSFEGPLEGLAALAGQLGGGLASPEAFINRLPGLTSVLERVAPGVAGRILGAAGTQAAVQGGVNPAIQGFENLTGARKGFSVGEFAGAVAGGAVIGGALHGAGEAVGALMRSGKKVTPEELSAAALTDAAAKRRAEADNMAALAAEDPSLRAGGDLQNQPRDMSRDMRATETGKPVTEQDQALRPADAAVDAPPPAAGEGSAPAMDASAVVASPDEAAARAASDVPPSSVAERVSEPAAAKAEGGPKFEIVPAEHDDLGMVKPGKVDDRIYRILRDGEPVGYTNVRVDGETADVRDIFTHLGGGNVDLSRGVFGPRAMSQIMQQFLAENPSVKRLTGERVSGARRGGAHGLAGTGERVDIAIPESRQGNAPRRTTAGKPLSISQFIARNGGIALDGDARAQGLDKMFSPGGGPVARERGRSIDGFWREKLIENGYLPPDADGGMARDIRGELSDALARERGGDRIYSAQDDVPVASEIDNLHREVEAESRKVAKALKKVGVSERETDPRTLSDAAELMHRGDETDPLTAYERAAMMREPPEDVSAVYGEAGRSFADEVQFRRARRDGGAPGEAGRRGDGSRPEGRPAGPGGELPRAGEGGPAEGIQFRREAGGVGDVQRRVNREAAAGGEPGKPGPPDGAVAAAAASEAPNAAEVQSLQQQAQALADALDLPLRQGRVQGGKTALGQYDTGQDVTRVRNVADFETVAHEAGHALEKKVGEPLKALVRRFAAELGPLDYDPQAARPSEGFAEWLRGMMSNQAMGERQAPGFSAAFRDLMDREAPDLLNGIDSAAAAHQAYLAAPTGEKLAAMVRKPEERGVLATLKREGLPKTISIYMTKWYEGLADDKAPVNRAVRDLARQMKAQTGKVVDLQGADNPELLLRLGARSQQAAVQDMREGVRPYRGVAPEGPSLHDAIATATGVPSALGRWDEAGVESFNRYLVARRAEVLYRKFEAGEMERRPLALSADEVRAQVAEMDAANPNLRAGAEMFHGYTRQILRKQYESGLISAETYSGLMAEEFYAPMFRHMDERPDGLGGGSGGRDGPGKVDLIKRMRGSDRDIIPPIDSMMTQTFLVNRTVAQNDTIKSFVALAREVRAAGGTGVGRIIEEIPPTQMVGKSFEISDSVAAAARRAGTDEADLAVLQGALTDVFGDDPIMASIFRAEPTGKRGEPIVFYKDGGQLRAVRMISKEEGMGLYEAVAGLPPVAKDWALGAAMATSGITRAAITGDPTFAISNFVRDQIATALYRPDYIPFISGLRGIKSEITQDNIAGMYAYAGGMSPGTGAAGLTELMEHDINALARKGWGVQKLGGLGDAMRGDIKAGFVAMTETVATAESATRLSVFRKIYDQKKRQGLSDYDAMLEAAGGATDLMDFSRHGSGTLLIRQLVPFMNAWKEGLDKNRRATFEPLFRAARGDIVTSEDRELLKNAPLVLAKEFVVLGGLGFAYGMWASKYEAYHDASPELRATNWIVPGAAFGFRPNSTLLIPKPFEMAIGNNLGEMAGLRAATGDPRTAHWAAEGVYELLAPPNPFTGIPGVKTYYELKTNRSTFTGKDIVKEQDQNKDNPGLEYNDKTSSIAKAIGGALGVSPIKIDYAVGSMFSTMGRNVLAASNTADPNAPDASADETMFVKRWIKDADRSSETTKLFWEQSAQRNGTFAQARNRYADLVKNGKMREAFDYLGQMPASQRAFVILAESGSDESSKATFNADDRRLHPITRAAEAVTVTGGLIKDLTANRQQTFEDGTPIKMTPTQRRDVIDSLRVLQAMEQRNALVLTGQKGYEGRPLLSVEDQFAVLKAQNPAAADELATRYATNKILPTKAVAEFWPQAQKALLADGSQADIREFSIEAKSDGWAFGGDAVRKPQRRRVSIDPNTAPAPTAPRINPALSVPHTTPVPNPFQ